MKRTYTPYRAAPTLLVALALGAVAAGCESQAEEACDRYCACEPCSDRDHERCVIDVEAEIDRADAYGCSEEADHLYDCIASQSWCYYQRWRYDDTCAYEDDALDWCIQRNSALH